MTSLITVPLGNQLVICLTVFYQTRLLEKCYGSYNHMVSYAINITHTGHFINISIQNSAIHNNFVFFSPFRFSSIL